MFRGRVPAAGEPHFTDDDYQVALMWQSEQDLQCPGCSQPKDEVWVFDPSEQRDMEARWRSTMRKCVVCASRDFRVSQHNGADHPDRHGMWPTVERVTDG